MTLLDAMEKFILHLIAEKGRSPETVRAYRGDLEDFSGYLLRNGHDITNLEVSAIGSSHVRGFLAALHGKAKKVTIGRKLAAIRSFFRYLLREKIVDVHPAAALRAPKPEKPLPKAVSVDELERFFHRAPFSVRDAAIFELLYSSGLRVGELTGLLVGSVDLNTGWVRVVGKGDKERMVPVGEKALHALRSYLTERIRENRAPDPHAPLFLTRKGGPLSTREVRRILKPYVEAAGIERNVSPHSFRHSFATALLHGGADLRSIQEMLGHAGLSVTQRYTKMDLGALMEVYDKAHPRSGVDDEEP